MDSIRLECMTKQVCIEVFSCQTSLLSLSRAVKILLTHINKPTDFVIVFLIFGLDLVKVCGHKRVESMVVS